MAKQRLNKDQAAEVFASGTIGAETAAGNKSLVEEYNSGITKTNSTTYTVVTPGMYYVHFQQLISVAATAMYLYIFKNGAQTKYGYGPGSTFQDVIANDMLSLAAGDTIQINQSIAITNSWAGGHSSYQIILIKRA